jgi:hypothetical protein
MTDTKNKSGTITGKALTDEQQYFRETAYKEPVESIGRIEDMAKFLAGAVATVSGLFLAAFRLALAGKPAEGLVWYMPVVLWGLSILMLVLVLFPRRYVTGKNEPAAWKAVFVKARWYKYTWLAAGTLLFVAGLIAAVVPLVHGS